MSRFKKIATAMYADRKFRALSKPQPNGQTLWIYLLTGPHTTAIPGLSTSGESAMAEALEWTLEGFRKAFGEVFAKGMAKADWKARVVWVPNASKYNPPESPNVIKAWSKAWPEIPECELKLVAFTHLKGFVEGLGEGFREAFAASFKQVSVQASSNQEQEQEQEQEQKNPPTPPSGGTGSAGAVAAGKQPVLAGFKRFWDEWPDHFRKKGRSKCLRHWVASGLEAMADAIVAAVRRHKASPEWNRERGQYIPGPLPWLNDESWEVPPDALEPVADGSEDSEDFTSADYVPPPLTAEVIAAIDAPVEDLP